MQTGNSTGIRLATEIDRPRVLTQHGKQSPGQYPNQGNQNGQARTGAATPSGGAHPQQVGPQGGARATRVFVFGCDRLSQAGMIAYLRDCPGIELVPEAGMATADVTVVAAEAMDEPGLVALRAVQESGARRTLLVVGEIDARGVADAFDAGVIGILRRSAITTRSLARAIASAQAGESVLPTELLTRLVRQVRSPRPRVSSLKEGTSAPTSTVEVPPAQAHTERELAVLRMLGEGCDTREIARRLAYSERTVKTVIQDLSQRLGLRNRSHAVAYAVRNGLI
ncbi:response regulator transcription factor [Kineosporia rhizophila]|uniref:helix-turn-helix transcriptional regulator n=1 Tax=Kineosporia TaxID=49184 RepID=UPI001E4E8AF1|nr:MULTISPECIES: response regulator transcription factor [Kineosporia]MCE0540627.1 response regulator transcription factor [Kineosporia rhizophila]GLY20217.1 helix-turn-helix transcriptional regulator [Kineosporia sp. NBRC 101677]